MLAAQREIIMPSKSRKARMYSLFELDENGKYKRISTLAMPKAKAVVFWQNRLLAHAMGYEVCGPRALKPVTETKPVLNNQ